MPIFALAQTAGQYDNEAISAYAKGDILGMVAASNKALAVDSNDADAYDNRAVGEDALGSRAAALEDFARAIALDPKRDFFYANRAATLHHAGDFLKAIADYSRAIGLKPKTEYYRLRGNTRKDAGDLDGGISDYNQAIALNPSGGEPYTDRGIIRQSQGQSTAAIADYTKAIQLDPKSARAYQNRGAVKFSIDDTDGAIADLTRAIAPDPKSSEAYENLGIARIGKRDFDGAIDALSHALVLAPKEASNYSTRGLAEALKGDYKSAIADFNRALLIKPGDPFSMKYRAAAKFGSRDFQGAVIDAKDVLRVDPRDATVCRIMGDSLFASGGLQDAMVNYRRSIELDPDEEERSRFPLWLVRVQLNQKKEADAELAEFLIRRPRAAWGDATGRIGNFLLGRINESDFLAATAEADSPAEQARAWYYVGMKRLMSGDPRSARTAFEQAVASHQDAVSETTFALQKLDPETPRASASPMPASSSSDYQLNANTLAAIAKSFSPTPTPASSSSNYQLNADTLAAIAKSFSPTPTPAGPANRNRPPLIDPNAFIRPMKEVGKPDHTPELRVPTPDPITAADIRSSENPPSPVPSGRPSDPGALIMYYFERSKRYLPVVWLAAAVIALVTGFAKWIFAEWEDQERRSVAIASLILGLGSNAVYPLFLGPIAIVCGAFAALRGNRVGWTGLGFGSLGLVGTIIWRALRQ